MGEDLQEMSAWCERVDSVEVDKGKEGLGISIIDCKVNDLHSGVTQFAKNIFFRLETSS